MRLLFVHDHRFYRDGSGAVLTSGSLPAPIWDRYLTHFDTVQVVGRDGGPAPATANLALSSHSGVSFDLIRHANYGQLMLGSKGVREQILSNVKMCDAAILRLPSELGFLAVGECRRAGIPYAVEMVGCAWDAMCNHGSPLARFYAPLLYLRTRRALREAPLALYVTSRWLQRRYPSRGRTYAASDVEIEPMSAQDTEARKARLRRIADGEAPRLGTVASLRIRSKGVQTAIAAVKALRNQGLALHYHVLGPGDPSPWVALAERHGVGDLVSFDGTRPAGEGVRKWLDEIDIHLQPSFQEGLPRATVEAMSRGAACIGSTCGGIPELLPPERLHEPGDVAALAERIRMLATSPAALARASDEDLATSCAFEPQRLAAIRSQFLTELRSEAHGAS